MTLCSIEPIGFATITIATLNNNLCFTGLDCDFFTEKNKLFPNYKLIQDQVDPVIIKKVLSVIETGNEENIDYTLIGTDFQIKVWNAISKIKKGKTVSYQELAKQIGKPKAYRAVASSCRNNPLCFIVPCHRVIHSNGDISGYRYGNNIKRGLLLREGAIK